MVLLAAARAGRPLITSAARAADALAAVVVEGDRLLALARSARSLSTSSISRNDMSGSDVCVAAVVGLDEACRPSDSRFFWRQTVQREVHGGVSSLALLTCSSAVCRWTFSKASGSRVQLRRLAVARVLPGGDVAEVLVVALGLAVGASGTPRGSGRRRTRSRSRASQAHQLAELEEVGHAAGRLEGLVQLVARRPATLTFFQNSSRSAGICLQRLLEARLVAGHAAVFPHDLAELAVERVDGALALDARAAACVRAVDLGLGLLERGMVGRRPCRDLCRGEVVRRWCRGG